MPERNESKDEDRCEDNVLGPSEWDIDVPRKFNLEGGSKCRVIGEELPNDPEIVTPVP